MKLLEPIVINHKTLHGRLVMPPMATAKSDDDDHVSQEILDYYQEKTTGGHLALVIIEHSYITNQGKANAKQLSVASDSSISGLTKLASTIHANGSAVLMQINHAGSAAFQGSPKVVSASNGTHPRTKLDFEALSIDEINTIVTEFQQAALRAQQAGFDGVEIHAAHGYLLSQFYSPKTNKRIDDYGGTIKNRIRFHLEVIHAIKSVVDSNFLVIIRFGACDYRDGGSTIEDAVTAAKCFEEAGIDAIDITGGLVGYIHPNSTLPGWFQDASRAIKAECSIPVFLTGGVTELSQAEALLKDGAADMIGIGRSILKDSNFLKDELALVEKK